MLLTVNWRNELINRIRAYKSLSISLKDIESELSVVKQRDPLTSTKGADDLQYKHNTGNENTHIAIMLSEKEKKLQNHKNDYKRIVNELDAGFRLLSDLEFKVITKRFMSNKSIEDTACDLEISVSYVKKLTDKALTKMESQMIKY